LKGEFILNYKEASKHFLENEKQFHLGVIPTEQSNPRTRNLSSAIAKDTKEGARIILSADTDIPTVVATAMKTKEYQQLIEDIVVVMEQRKKFVLSSVGASGRMALTLGSMWRNFWTSLVEKLPHRKELCVEMCQVSDDFMTGGDRALVRSVENYEDYMTFGREQIKEAGVGPGDLVLGLAECGLSASINGSVLEADDRGCNTYYFFTNPQDILCKTLERTRLVFERKNIHHINLFVGNMAVSGSTRMQSASVQLLAVGAALEMAIWKFIQKEFTADELKVVGKGVLAPNEYTESYVKMLADLSQGDALSGLAKAIDLETETYKANGLVTYTTHDYLIDIMTDTTERQPTFTLPPFRKFNDQKSAISWAYVKDPLYPSTVAWNQIFKRPLKGLEWSKEDYIRMGAHQSIIDNPPLVGVDQIFEYNIGYENDPSRYSRKPARLIAIDINGSATTQMMKWFYDNQPNFSEGVAIRLGKIPATKLVENEVHIPIELPETLLDLMTHMMVKVAFNLISTGTMAKMNRVWSNWMIQVFPTNKKLIDRSTRIIAQLSGLTYEKANEEFFKTMHEREVGQEYRESYVVETLRRLGFNPTEETK
jgi:N-acetylmuramic acid 6-phosphate etherase